MRYKSHIFITGLVLSFALLANVAFAHVVVKPAQVGVAAFQTFTISVPVEKDIPTVSLRLVIPDGINEVTPTVKSGWKITTKKDKGRVSEINWSGGTIPAGFRDDFTFSAQAPAATAELHWKAYQTYSDGSVVSWDAVPDQSNDTTNKGPYSVTKVVNDLDVAPAQKDSNTTPAYILAVVALALSMVSLIKSRPSIRTSKK